MVRNCARDCETVRLVRRTRCQDVRVPHEVDLVGGDDECLRVNPHEMQEAAVCGDPLPQKLGVQKSRPGHLARELCVRSYACT